MAETREIGYRTYFYLQDDLNDNIVGYSTDAASQILGTIVNWGNIKGDISLQADLIAVLTKLKNELEEKIGTGAGAGITSIFTYKGQVAAEANLPNGAAVGDVYDVADTGANYVWNGSSWDKLSESLAGLAKTEDVEQLRTALQAAIDETSTNLQAAIQAEQEARVAAENAILLQIDAKLDTVTYNEFKTQTQTNITNLQTDVQGLKTDMEDVQTDLVTVKTDVTTLDSKITDLKSLDPEVVVLYDGSDTEFINKEKDFVLSGLITAGTSVAGNSIVLNDITMPASYVNLIAAQDVTVKDVTLTGVIPKKVTNSLFNIKSDGYVSIRDCTINPEACYNGIEIGQGLGLAKSVVIDNVDFAGHFANHAISIYGMANNGVITISNCHFADVSNMLRLSNRTNTIYTVNIINCTVDRWDVRDLSQGMILLQDNDAETAEEAAERDCFKNLVINIQNVTGPNGKIQGNLEDLCGLPKEGRVIYMWDEVRNTVPYGSNYPTIIIR